MAMAANMFRKCVILTLVLMITIVNTSAIGSRTKRDTYVILPTYSVWLIGFFMIVMVLIILSLLFVLWKQRCNKFKRLSTQETYVKYEKSDYVRQDSNDIRSLKKMNSFENPYSNESTLTINSAIIDVVDAPLPLHLPTRVENDFRITPKRSNKKVTNETIMRKDQIDQIIKKTLSKNSQDETASFRNLDELLSEANKKEDKSIRIYDKAASTPDLDVYDVLPAPRSPVKGLSDEEFEMDQPVYDCPPRQRNIIIPVMNGRYVTPISNDDLQAEPCYINAHVHRLKQ